MNLEAIYNQLCRTGTPKADLERMSDRAVAELVKHLEASGVNSGIPALLTGMVEQEAAKRFAIEHLGREGAVGEGSV